LLSIGVAVPFILVQKNFRRLLAYSSIDHSGIMVLALGFGGPLGMLGMLLHMTFHSITKPLLFFCAGNVQQELKTDLFRKTKGGLIHSMPLTGAAFIMVTLAVTGSPPFSFFQSEFTILRASFSAGYFTLAAIFTGFLVAIFSGFLVHIANLVLGENPGLARTDMCGWKKYSVVGLAAVTVIMGFWIPAPLFRLIQQAAEILMAKP
jgi:hydrogenase-4 component F